jgi:hypothetical protein
MLFKKGKGEWWVEERNRTLKLRRDLIGEKRTFALIRPQALHRQGKKDFFPGMAKKGYLFP